jgi:hypothetical protein
MSDDQVADAPTFERIADDLLLRGRRIVTYNADFDPGHPANELAFPGGFARGWDAARAVMRQQHWRCAITVCGLCRGTQTTTDRMVAALAGGIHTARRLPPVWTLRRMAEDQANSRAVSEKR